MNRKAQRARHMRGAFQRTPKPLPRLPRGPMEGAPLFVRVLLRWRPAGVV